MAGGAFGKLGESAADCGGVERGAPPRCSVSGLAEGTVEAYCSPLPSHPCSVNSCELFYFVVIIQQTRSPQPDAHFRSVILRQVKDG